MKNFKLSPSATTPFVEMNYANGEIRIIGRSIAFNAHEFWNPVLNWFFNYMEQPCVQTTLIIQLDYINSSSTKQIVKLLQLANINFSKGQITKVYWFVEINDIDAYEMGIDLKTKLRLPLIVKTFDCNNSDWDNSSVVT
jgi:hypothetical protein